MAKIEKLPKTNASEIESLIERLKGTRFKPGDTELIEHLFRTVIMLLTLVRPTGADAWLPDGYRPQSAVQVCVFCGASFHDPEGRSGVSDPVIAQLDRSHMNIEEESRE